MDDFDDEDGGSGGGREKFIDRQEKPTRAGLICPDVRGHMSLHSIEARKAEFEGLAGAIRLDIVFSEVVKVREIRPATFIGGGNVESLAKRVKEDEIDLLLVDAALTPIQQRNLEREAGTKVLDRTALILEIFGERAATREGVLQVELAHLNYQKSRLVRSWTHLERQRGSGGMGFMGGPGETQIESDRRQITERIVLLEDRLEKVKKTRAQQRQKRNKAPYPIVALVGYTNAGKSSLFNILTGAGVFAEDLLFATLDTTIRKLELPHGREVMLSDTVGFVADLPHDLVAAFRATLEEVVDADVILHARDIANPDHSAQAQDVLTVLAELGVNPETTPVIEVWNKIDRLPDPETALASVSPAGKVAATVPVSAKTGQGLDALKLAIESAFGDKSRTYHVHVPHSAGSDIGWLHSHAEIIGRNEPTELGSDYVVRVDTRHRAAFLERFNGRIAISDL
ncbi:MULTISPECIES: GTPase HflX [Devosia]|uniref:GTPase HflX n=1 Tax=Devosia equisanguinis TaxID=2490941 RepID=A0A3S4GLV2_9HYPH|nr:MULTISPECIES: GTPase HflX [Devosia]ODT49240.1 MAG: GTPase HflX [Pelagibacterium sp. SCN 63-126]ODU85615.1 MAG: GTPase HflX [Pelagibacterium sp. SCN 63-17]OJX43457.1 MAG: GTPase HflX [Devosia sp. 63-57]VDS05994.1 GTPase HflX [Devosia equisanguinis]